MTDTDDPEKNGLSINANEEVTIAGDVVGRDKIIHNYFTEPAADPAASRTGLDRRLRLTVHIAAFLNIGAPCYFINATNLSERDIEITHVWLECDPVLHILQPDRPLPKRLQPDETWETWIEVYRVPDACGDPHSLARARLSTGAVVNSVKNEAVPSRGYVPGGPIKGRSGAGSSP